MSVATWGTLATSLVYVTVWAWICALLSVMPTASPFLAFLSASLILRSLPFSDSFAHKRELVLKVGCGVWLGSKLTRWKSLAVIGRQCRTVEDGSSLYLKGSNTSRSH